MEVSATYTFDAPRQRVWDLLTDPAEIAGCLPGCDSMEPAGDDTWRATLTIGVAAITGRYEGTVRMTDQQAPERYTLNVNGRGRPGFVNGSATLTLSEEDGGARTRVEVAGKAQVGGTIARVGQRLIGGVSKMTMDRFFTCLQQRAAARPGA